MDERAQRARELREAGMKWATLAAELGFASPGAAVTAAKRAGLTGLRTYDSKHKSDDERREHLKLAQRRHQLRKYGLTPEQYEEMRAAQDGLCAICGRDEKLVVDHDHDTGDVRGLLCGRCNTALGGFEDNIGLVGQAGIYLAWGPEVSMASVREDYPGAPRAWMVK